jgi:hypothetical protein
MPLPLPNLDDRRFDELVQELVNRIPTLSDQYTDFNPSDPGIMLIELLAYIGEMVIYRLNQITERSRRNFLKLLLEPPTPVTVDVTFTLSMHLGQFLSPPFSAIIPLGTVVASKDTDSKDLFFETIEEAPIFSNLSSPPEEISVTVPARSMSIVENETIGISNGKRSQVFTLKETPVLLDPNFISHPGYNPNPIVKVKKKEESDWNYWEFKIDLLDSRPGDLHFTVESLTGNLRFGDGKKGKIPPQAAVIVCERYRKILGDEARVLAGQIAELRSDVPGFVSDEIMVSNPSDAVGGTNVFSIEEGYSKGLQLFHEPHRAITVADYEYLIKTVFNREFGSKPGQERVARVKCLPQFSQDSIYLMIIPDPATACFSKAVLESPLQQAIEYPQPSEDLLQRVRKFLESRRLITVRLLVEGPSYQGVKIEIVVVRKENTNKQQVAKDVTAGIKTYLNPLNGGVDQTGWPFGRSLYKSEMYAIVENIEGVDHVESIFFRATDEATTTENQIDIGERKLIKIDDLKVTTKP